MKKFPLKEASEKSGMEEKFIVHCIKSKWLIPAEPNELALDEEDLARLQLIRELTEEMGANEDAVPIILHLLDQLYFLQAQLNRLGRAS